MSSPLKVIQLHNNREQLIKKAIKNDRAAQHELFNLFAPKMLSVCRYYISDIQFAEEAMLNGFFKVFKYLRDFKSEGSFEGWIRRIMIRESISYLRAQKNLEFLVEEEEIDNQVNYTSEMDFAIDDVQKLIDMLPEGYRIIFNMYAIEGYKHHEIAEMLKISEGTSKSQLFKARKMLQHKLNELNNTSYGTN